MKILFWHRLNKTNQRGEAPIYCRLTINKIRGKDFSTGIFCAPGHFISKQQKLKDEILNCQLSTFKTRIMKLYIELDNQDQKITSDMICKILKGKTPGNNSLKNFMATYMLHREKLCIVKEISNDTLRINENFKTNVLLFMQHQNKNTVELQEVNCTFANDLYYFLLEHKQVSKSYAVKNIQFLKAVLNHAVMLGAIKFNPIVAMRFKRGATKKIEFLSPEELNRLSAHRFASDRLQQVADLFILQCNTGFAYIDLMNFCIDKHLETDNKNRTWITMSRTKTGNESVLPLFPEAKQILDKYTRINIESKKTLQLPKITNQKYNAYIKEVGEIVGINRHLTTHIGRKTFGTIALNKGFSIESVSKMLGHTSIKTTETHYAVVLRRRIVGEN